MVLLCSAQVWNRISPGRGQVDFDRRVSNGGGSSAPWIHGSIRLLEKIEIQFKLSRRVGHYCRSCMALVSRQMFITDTDVLDL